MKKWISALLALVLTAGLCAGCAESEPPSGIYYDITGLDPKETVMEVDGNTIPAEQYLYWVAYNCSSLEYNLGMYNSLYGTYGELFDENGALDWNAAFQGEVTLGQYAKSQAEEAVRFYANIENMAQAQGVALTEADRAAMDETVAEVVEQLGSEEAFQNNLDQMGISRETYDRISSTTYLFDHLVDLVLDESSELFLPLESYGQYAAYADHILLATKDLTTYTDLDEEAVSAKRAKAEELLAQLQNAEDVQALFQELADANSEDTGRAANPDGYVFGKGEMVEAFEDAAFSLQPGEISGIVESDTEKRRELAEEHLNSILRGRSEVVYSDKISSLDAGTFYVAYSAAAAAMEAANAPAEGENGTDGADPSTPDAAGDGEQPVTPGSTGGTAE